MSNDYSKIYPYTITPSQNKANINTLLKCKKEDELQTIIFNDDKLEVIKGAENLAELNLNTVFIPTKSYVVMNLLLEPSIDTSIILNSEQLTRIDFIAIIPNYLKVDLENQNNWHILMKYVDEVEWVELHRIFILSSKNIKNIELRNIQDVSIPIQVLLGNTYQN